MTPKGPWPSGRCRPRGRRRYAEGARVQGVQGGAGGYPLFAPFAPFCQVCTLLPGLHPSARFAPLYTGNSRNSNPRNGLALSKNALWLLDNGLWTLSDDYRVITAEGHFDEAGIDHRLLREYHGQKILLPANPAY